MDMVDINAVHKETFRLCQVMGQHFLAVNQNTPYSFSGSVTAKFAAIPIRNFLLSDDGLPMDLKVQALESAFLSTPVGHFGALMNKVDVKYMRSLELDVSTDSAKSNSRMTVMMGRWATRLIEELTPILKQVVSPQAASGNFAFIHSEES